VADHDRLGQGEVGEDSDRVERDQGVGVAAGGDQQDPGEERQRPDPLVEYQAVTPNGEGAWFGCAASYDPLAIASRRSGESATVCAGGPTA
jgi:hypothetical protein